MHRTVAAMAFAVTTAVSLISTSADAQGFGRGIAPPFSPIFNKPVGPDFTRQQQHGTIQRSDSRRAKARAAAATRSAARAAALKAKRDAAARAAEAETAAIRREAAILRAKNRKLMQEKAAAAARPAEVPAAAQAEQQAKVERLVRQLDGGAKAQPAAAKTSGAPEPKAAPVKPGSGECTRFIPSAGMTVSVPCSQ